MDSNWMEVFIVIILYIYIYNGNGYYNSDKKKRMIKSFKRF